MLHDYTIDKIGFFKLKMMLKVSQRCINPMCRIDFTPEKTKCMFFRYADFRTEVSNCNKNAVLFNT